MLWRSLRTLVVSHKTCKKPLPHSFKRSIIFQATLQLVLPYWATFLVCVLFQCAIPYGYLIYLVFFSSIRPLPFGFFYPRARKCSLTVHSPLAHLIQFLISFQPRNGSRSRFHPDRASKGVVVWFMYMSQTMPCVRNCTKQVWPMFLAWAPVQLLPRHRWRCRARCSHALALFCGWIQKIKLFLEQLGSCQDLCVRVRILPFCFFLLSLSLLDAPHAGTLHRAQLWPR